MLGIPKNPKLLQFVVLFTVVSSFVLLIRPLRPWISLEVTRSVIRPYARRPIDHTSLRREAIVCTLPPLFTFDSHLPDHFLRNATPLCRFTRPSSFAFPSLPVRISPADYTPRVDGWSAKSPPNKSKDNPRPGQISVIQYRPARMKPPIAGLSTPSPVQPSQVGECERGQQLLSHKL